MKAVVYKTNSGFSKQFAELFAEQKGVPCLELSAAQKQLTKGDAIAYFGWVMAGKVAGYKKAARRFDVVCVCPVGMATPDENVYQDIVSHNKIDPEKLFVLQGGFDLKRLHGIYFYMMKSMAAGVLQKLKAKPELSDEERLMMDMFENGKDCVSLEQLQDVIEYTQDK